MTAGHKSTQAGGHILLFYRRQPEHRGRLQAPAARQLRPGDTAAGSGLRLIPAHVDKLSVTKT